MPSKFRNPEVQSQAVCEGLLTAQAVRKTSFLTSFKFWHLMIVSEATSLQTCLYVAMSPVSGVLSEIPLPPPVRTFVIRFKTHLNNQR